MAFTLPPKKILAKALKLLPQADKEQLHQQYLQKKAATLKYWQKQPK